MTSAKDLAEEVTVHLHGPDHTMYHTRKVIETAIIRARVEAFQEAAEIADDHEDEHHVDDIICCRQNCPMIIAGKLTKRSLELDTLGRAEEIEGSPTK